MRRFALLPYGKRSSFCSIYEVGAVRLEPSALLSAFSWTPRKTPPGRAYLRIPGIRRIRIYYFIADVMTAASITSDAACTAASTTQHLTLSTDTSRSAFRRFRNLRTSALEHLRKENMQLVKRLPDLSARSVIVLLSRSDTTLPSSTTSLGC